jgi:dihydrofolate reductase
MPIQNLNAIVAMCQNFGIGCDNKLPWHISADLKYFREKTLNTTVVMGRKTFESIGSKPLPNRKNIVITSSLALKDDDSENITFYTKQQFDEYLIRTEDTVFIIGGGQLYTDYIDKISTLYVTNIYSPYPCDVFFPNCWDRFTLDERTTRIFDKNEHCWYSFDTYINKK